MHIWELRNWTIVGCCMEPVLVAAFPANAISLKLNESSQASQGSMHAKRETVVRCTMLSNIELTVFFLKLFFRIFLFTLSMYAGPVLPLSIFFVAWGAALVAGISQFVCLLFFSATCKSWHLAQNTIAHSIPKVSQHIEGTRYKSNKETTQKNVFLNFPFYPPLFVKETVQEVRSIRGTQQKTKRK